MELRRTDAFIDWFRSIRDGAAKARIAKRLLRIENTGELGDHAGVGDGVFELRFHFGPGYRVYCLRRGNETIILLGGGIKDTQPGDIVRAKALAREI